MSKSAGFTLIELLTVVAVIAVLSAIAVPSYTQYVTRSKITEATSQLADLRVKMEQWFQDNRTYVGGTCAPTGSAAAQVKYFTFSCIAGQPTPTTYTIQAVGGTASDAGMVGFVYSIDQSNAKATSITAGSPAESAGWTGNGNCWVIRKGGQC
ncbi:MAG: type IV pilin protein [Burkholderiales bacterium]